MKKLLIPFLLLFSASLFAQPWKSVEGNGNIKKETRHVSEFTSILSRGPMEVKISYGNSNTIEVEADENLLQYIETSVENGKLTIKPKSNMNLKSSGKMTVYISMSKINSLQLSGSGTLEADGKFDTGEKTSLVLSGSGNIKLNSGSFENLSMIVSGSGNIEVKGENANAITASISGSGNIDCTEVPTDNLEALISGSGNVKAYVTENITGNISGSGNIFYKGDATNITIKTIGSGKVIKSDS